ncbi:hypothetical protein MBLNU230_g3736t1 [Neophaeotheca triangularis]
MPDLSPTKPNTSANPAPDSPHIHESNNNSSSHFANGGTSRPPLAKRHSSASASGASSSGTMRHVARDSSIFSLGSEKEQHHPLRHTVKPAGRHARVVLPRNHSSGRNLQRLARNVQSAHAAAEEGKRQHDRARSDDHSSHDGRLPGSFGRVEGESSGAGSARSQGLRRNHTSTQLPRNNSNAKLKKNFSHGHLQRAGANAGGSTAAGLRSVTSPRLKGKSKRPKSGEVQPEELDLHQQEVELARQIRERREGGPQQKRVGFAVGSPGDTSGDSDGPQMEGQGLQEDEWTEESASASPYSTRQNTANNSRRTSVVQERHSSENEPAQTQQSALPTSPPQPPPETNKPPERPEAVTTTDFGGEYAEADGTPAPSPEPEESSEGSSPPSPRTTAPLEKTDTAETVRPAPTAAPQPQSSPEQKSPTQPSRDPQDPTRRLLDRSTQHAAPALVSDINTMGHSSKNGSPAPSTRSGSHDEDELVSRFIPSASHPSTGSGANTTTSTPKQGSLHTPEDEPALLSRNRSAPHFQVGSVGAPSSPGSGSVSGTSTPALGRSRTELKLQQEKALAELETAQERIPVVPAHVYDRRNESLKSYLNLAVLHSHEGTSPRSGAGPPAILGASGNLSLGPEVFQGRFRAVGTELRVVQTYRDPIGESVARLRDCQGSKLAPKPKNPSPSKAAASQQSQLRQTKSAISLPAQRLREQRGAPSGSTSATAAGSPPASNNSDPTRKPELQSAKSATHVASASLHNVNNKTEPTSAPQAARRGVSFAGTPKPLDEPRRSSLGGAAAAASVEDGTATVTGGENQRADVLARLMWESVLSGGQ